MSGSGTKRFRSSAWWRSGLSFWSSSADAPRVRRPTDIALVVIGVLTLALLSIPAPGPTELDASVAALLAALPGLVGWFWESLYALALLWALVLLVVAASTRHRRLLLVEQLLAAVVATLVAGLLAVHAGATWDQVWHQLVSHDSSTVFPAARMALVAAVVAVSAPHLARPHRRIGAAVVVLGGLGAIALPVDTLLGLVAGITLGLTAGAAVNVAVGSPGGHAPIELLREEMTDLGVEPAELDYVKRPFAVVARGTTVGGAPVQVRVYGRDAWEGSLFAALWQRLWTRRSTSVTTVGRQTQAEHEAFLTLLAERGGAPVQPVLAAGTAWGRDALLVRADEGRRFGDLADGEVSDDVVRAAWSALASLHASGVAHRGIDGEAVVLTDDGRVLLTDLDRGTSSPEGRELASDDAHLLVTLALAVGVGTATRIALEEIGPERLVATAAYLQPAAFEPDVRARIKASPWSMKQLREAVTTETGAEAPPLEKIRRVSPAALLMLAVLVLVAYAVIGAIAGVGWSTIVSEFQSASWWWVAAAVVIAMFVYVGQAIAMQGAAEQRLPLVPVVGLETSIAFIGLAVPASAAKIGLTIRFLQLVGGNPTAAVAISLIDSLAGFVVQILVVVLTLFTGLVTLTPVTAGGGSKIGSTLAGIDWTAVVVLAAVLLVVAVLVLRFVPRARAFVLARTAESRGSLRVLRSPRNLARIAAGSVLWNVVAALALGASLRAFGGEATFAELILVNTLVALFAGLMPVPGNVGVAEAALTAGLTALGIDQAVALSTALVYRLATFYVPAAYGAVSLRLMRRRGYL